MTGWEGQDLRIEKSAATDTVVKQQVFDLVERRHEKTTPVLLEKTVSEALGCGRKAVRSALKSLVEEGRLKYTYMFGCAFVEPSFDRPVRISERVVLKPPGLDFNPEKSCHVIEIASGASFGAGDHPTTRIAIRGIEYAFSHYPEILSGETPLALDIGTGSGVLALTVLKFGIHKAVGLDIDPCARAEAAENARVNGLADRFEIGNVPIGEIHGSFALVTANLRLPTLKMLRRNLIDIIEKNGIVVVSGLKADELGAITDKYAPRFRRGWAETEKDWAGAVFLGS